MITMNADWRGALCAAGKRATARSYQGEVLSFETAASFFGKLTERRWVLAHALQGQGADVGAGTGTPCRPRHPARS